MSTPSPPTRQRTKLRRLYPTPQAQTAAAGKSSRAGLWTEDGLSLPAVVLSDREEVLLETQESAAQVTEQGAIGRIRRDAVSPLGLAFAVEKAYALRRRACGAPRRSGTRATPGASHARRRPSGVRPPRSPTSPRPTLGRGPDVPFHGDGCSATEGSSQDHRNSSIPHPSSRSQP